MRDTKSQAQQLTPKQRHFARCVVSGSSYSDAYREAYNCENMKPGNVNREASVLASNPKVSTWIRELQGRKDAVITAAAVNDRERVLVKLRDLLANAEGTPAEQVMLRAADLLGKSVGLYKDVTVDETPKSSGDLMAEIQARLADLGVEAEDTPDMSGAGEDESLH